jgi:anti-sigma B factor antagonist
MASVELRKREYGDLVVVGLCGELDAVNTDEFVASLSAVARSGRRIVVDLAGLGFIDCCAAAGLLRVRELAVRAGGDLSLAAAAGLVLQLLTLISAADLLPVYASVVAAVGATDDGGGRPVTLSGGPRV